MLSEDDIRFLRDNMRFLRNTGFGDLDDEIRVLNFILEEEEAD